MPDLSATSNFLLRLSLCAQPSCFQVLIMSKKRLNLHARFGDRIGPKNGPKNDYIGKKNYLADGLGITMSRYVTLCSRD